MLRIIVLTGPIGAGKSTLVEKLEKRAHAEVLKTREEITRIALASTQFEEGRSSLQLFGEHLDRETGGKWVTDALQNAVDLHPQQELWVVDSARIQEQIDELRTHFGMTVFHIHLTGDRDTLTARYSGRTPKFPELASYSETQLNKTESSVDSLSLKADAVIDTTECTDEDVWVRAATHLHLFPRNYERLVDALIGGQFGSEGKGHIASFLAKEYDVLVRVGGPNAGHSVFERPEPFIHHQLPCGTRNTTAKLIIAPGATLRLPKLLAEIQQCGVTPDRLKIDYRAMMISDQDIEDERELIERISSTGQGGGAAAARKIIGRGLSSTKLAGDFSELKPFVTDSLELLEDAYRARSRILIEGTQGTGLSIHHGIYPYVTSRDTTVAGCLSEAGISATRLRKVIMVCRSYPIRVADPSGGSSGPLSQEVKWEAVSKRSGIPLATLEEKEVTSTTKRSRRVGGFDWVQLKRAAALNGPTDVALTFADYIDPINKDARRFEQLSSSTIQFIEEIENVAAAPVSLISTRFDFRSILDRRSW